MRKQKKTNGRTSASKSSLVPKSKDTKQRMQALSRELDWSYLIKVAEDRRAMTRVYLCGPAPKYRALTGAVILRSLESCTLRKTAEMIKEFAPARSLCGLTRSEWTPNFRTLSDFEIMLGEEGLREIQSYVSKVSRRLSLGSKSVAKVAKQPRLAASKRKK